MPPEFEGELHPIVPARLVHGEEDQVEDFFLALSLIFNDLKGLLGWDTIFRDIFRKPEDGEISYHAGEYNGFQLQIYRLIIGLINEFLAFLQANENVLKTSEFKLLVNELPSQLRETWADIENTALGHAPTEHASQFAKTLQLIRHKVAFHYQARKIFRKSFKNFFNIENDRRGLNTTAYYALGERMQNTRFFYADALAQEYIISIAKTLEHDPADNDLEVYEKHRGQVINFVDDMSKTIYFLLRAYVRGRPHL